MTNALKKIQKSKLKVSHTMSIPVSHDMQRSLSLLRSHWDRLHAGFQLSDELPALPQGQLELTEVELGNILALLHCADQVLECVSIVLEDLHAMLETA